MSARGVPNIIIIRKVNRNNKTGKISYSKIPVVPAGVIFLMCCTKSTLLSSGAVLQRQRIHRLVSSFGCRRDASSISKLLLNSSTIATVSIVWMLPRTLSGRERTDS